MNIQRILAPTDFSELSKQGLTSALELAETFGAKLLLLHVVEPPPYPVEGIVPSHLGATLLDDLERQASKDLAQMLSETHGSQGRGHAPCGSWHPLSQDRRSCGRGEERSNRHDDTWADRPQPLGHGQRHRKNCPHGAMPRVDDTAVLRNRLVGGFGTWQISWLMLLGYLHAKGTNSSSTTASSAGLCCV